ncbi:MAG: AAA family ATPase [Bacteriovoracales bacterium]|nr:AAA family ATPase [Bacteriovoracales bacterium]
MDVLSGIVERVTFHSEESGWSVLKVSPLKIREELVTVTVHQAKVFAGATVDFQGEWTEHPKYGPQFKAFALLEKRPASAAALEKYLGSGLIYGVGPKTAKKIVSHFRGDTLDVFEHEMERLTEVCGIAQGKLEMIRKSWTEHREIRNVMMFLQTHGVSTLFAVKIYKQYGREAVSIVEDNPYRLSQDIYGIGFLSADRIAKSLGIVGRDPRRVRAAVGHVLAASREEGHCYLRFSQVEKSVEDLLEETSLRELLKACLKEMEKAREIMTRKIGEDEGYYSKSLFYSEESVGKKILLLGRQKISVDEKRIWRWIEAFNRRQKQPLSQKQAQSVAGIAGQGFSILTGGPGCGKTTTTKAIVKLSQAMGKNVVLAAPTGRAAQRMEEVIGLAAKTIHRLLVWNPAKGGFKKGEDDPLEADFIVIDECSMLDISLTASLLKAVDTKNTQVLFIGDRDQLPSVGAGNVLGDLIDSEVVSVFRLTEVFRQAKESLIVRYAHKINGGEVPFIRSPFENPGLWQEGHDTLFIDSEEAGLDAVRFIQKAKRVFRDGGHIQAEGDEDEKEEKKEGGFLTIPEKFKHVCLEDLLASESQAQEVRAILRKVHPHSSLHYGLTATDMILKLYREILPKYFGRKVEIQVLTPMTRGSMGTLALNKKIQDECNAMAPGKKQLVFAQKVFRVGDRVIQKRNNYDLEVFNGDIGTVVGMDTAALELSVVYHGKSERKVVYKKENLPEIDLAYAITIHKSQGSEFDVVIIPMATQHFKLLFRNLVYTGLTRGKKGVVFVGTRKALALAVKNADNRKRQTYLQELLQAGPL